MLGLERAISVECSVGNTLQQNVKALLETALCCTTQVLHTSTYSGNNYMHGAGRTQYKQADGTGEAADPVTVMHYSVCVQDSAGATELIVKHSYLRLRSCSNF